MANKLSSTKNANKNPEKSPTFLAASGSYAESDEIFAHNIFASHSSNQHTFHADWGANIIIVNDRCLFTEFIPCEECLNPINGIPISEIKGFGTVIFMIGDKIVPVREVAYMPGNLQCTFTTSHIQRLNGYLPGIHAMYSPIKLISPEGTITKYAPTIKNGLDYMSVPVLTPKKDPNKITPTAYHARSISPQLIHQKYGHYFQDRIIELAKKKLIDGLLTSIPSLETPCPICMATKSNHHPRRPLADYTLLKPGQQMHMDWCFIGEPSIRGHVAILCIKRANTRKSWCFPSPNKRSPLDTVKFFILF